MRALAARDAALVVVYGPETAASAHGVEAPERIGDAELRAMAGKLGKKAGVMDAMRRNGRTHLLQPMAFWGWKRKLSGLLSTMIVWLPRRPPPP